MARLRLNPVIEQLRGKIGDLVFKRLRERSYVARNPDRSGLPPSEAQLVQRERFREAASYARLAMQDAGSLAFYEEVARRRKKPVFSTMVGDYLNRPRVNEIDASEYAGNNGDGIVIHALDDIEVARVDVVLTDDDGAILEYGPAALDLGRWLYVAQTNQPGGTTVNIQVRALDRPGGVGAQSVTVVTPEGS